MFLVLEYLLIDDSNSLDSNGPAGLKETARKQLKTLATQLGATYMTTDLTELLGLQAHESRSESRPPKQQQPILTVFFSIVFYSYFLCICCPGQQGEKFIMVANMAAIQCRNKIRILMSLGNFRD